VFGKVGVANATLDQIAERAGVSKGTIYLYFASKEEVFRQTIRHALARVSVAASSASPTTPSRQLRATTAEQWKFLTSEPVVRASRLVASEQWQYPDLAELYDAEVVTRFIDEVARILESGVRTGEFRDLDSRTAARMLAALEVQSASWRASGGGPLPPGQSSEEVLRELTEFYIQAISPLDSAFPQADGA
jgi:AcrR family transcriptional regulator